MFLLRAVVVGPLPLSGVFGGTHLGLVFGPIVEELGWKHKNKHQLNRH